MVAIAPTALAGVIPSSSLRSRALGASRSRVLAGGGKRFPPNHKHRGVNRRAGVSTVAAWGSQKYVEHLIQPGDSLWKIAMDYNSTVDEIRAANGVKDKAGMIYEGKTLRVPVNTIQQSNATPAADPVKTLVPPKKPRNLFAKEEPVFGPAPTAPPKKIERKAEEPKAKKAEPAPKETKKPTKNPHARGDIPSRDAQKGQEAWRAPFQHMAKGKITPLTKTDVESLLPRKVFLGVSPTLGDASAPRDADVLLLVEVPDSDACMAAYPTWKQLAERLGRSAPNVRVCAFSAETDAAKQWAGRHLAATSHPTFVAMPRAGGVYKFGGETATLELLKKFADEAFKKQNRRNDKNELNKSPVATHRGGRTRHPMDKPHASSEYYRGIGTTGGPVGAVVDASVQGAANVARMAAPLAIISLVVGFFMATALRILDLAFGESSAKVAGSAVGGSASAAAARLAAVVEESGDATTYPGTPVDSRGRAIAPGAAARRSSVEAQTRLARERAAAREMRARAALRDEDAIPSGASAAKLIEWIRVVESEMRDLWRRFVFLFWAWIRLQRRLLLARFKPEGGQDS